MAKEQKSLKICNRFGPFWAGIGSCIDEVQKVAQLTEKDCADIAKFEDLCLDRLGLKGEDARETANEALLDLKMNRLKPTVLYVPLGTKPGDIEAFKKNLLEGRSLDTWTITKVEQGKVFVDLNLTGQVVRKVLTFQKIENRWRLILK
jgi:hypothetical protein